MSFQNLEQFNFKYMSALVERVKDLWTPPEAEENFRCIYAEQIIRLDMHSNEMQFQLCEGDELRAIACASRKGEVNSGKIWWSEQYQKLTSEQQLSFRYCKDYLSMMEEKTYGYMKDDDVKLDLFISVKSGWGAKLLDAAMEYYKLKGFKNLYLWTDCECNVDWYFNHGYELVEECEYELFSRDNEAYKTYVFKKQLI